MLEDLTRPLASSERVLASGELEVPGLVLTLDAPAGAREPATTRIPVVSTAFADPGRYWLEAPTASASSSTSSPWPTTPTSSPATRS